MSAREPQIVDRDAEHCQVIHQNLLLTYTLGPATPENIDSLVRNMGVFFARLPRDKRGVFILYTRSTTRPPEGASRRKVQDTFDRYAEQLAGIAVVIESSGFVNAIIRTVASSLFTLTRSKLPVKFFSGAAECLPWVAERASMSRDDVRAAIEFAQQALPRER